MSVARAGTGAVLALVALAACGKPEPVAVGPRAAEPEVRVALVLAPPHRSASEAPPRWWRPLPMAVSRSNSPPAIPWSSLPPGTPSGFPGGAAPRESLTFVSPDPDGFVRVNGREYRGRVAVFVGRGGLSVVNRVNLESYLAGVVSAEMGRRDTTESEALEAQAVVSRTYALRNLGRWSAEGYDFRATVTDQVYGGVGAETPLGWRAVGRTTGLVLMYNGAPIDAFFFSTCGGRTADGTEVFANADRPYLRSVWDTDRAGAAYCRISPRYDWKVEWAGETLRDILAQTLPQATGRPVAPDAALEAVRVSGHTSSGRVERLTLTLDGHDVVSAGTGCPPGPPSHPGRNPPERQLHAD